ncbi:MAG TPA: hypothetical protein DEP42_04630 [Ruminococcaceae bacterium]|nr:hypothetical protein [Oscillospiraceae bacterium]
MEAVIMAGGEGTRLRPLTCDRPKPMVHLCGRPVLDYILELLAQNGITKATISLRYLSDRISSAYPNQRFAGISLRFVEEDKPLGTAGSVRGAIQNADEPILVMSGDALCDFDLRSAIQFHKEKKAAATLILSRVADPREYGLVVTDPSGAVRGFLEKPGWGQAVTDAVNTGIYILSKQALSLIPQNREFDFGKDLFPLMLQKSMPLFGFGVKGYWCDIGDIRAYAQSQFDLLDKKVSTHLDQAERNGIYADVPLPAGKYTIHPPVYIGKQVTIGEGAVVGPYAVLDDGSTVGDYTTLRRSILLPGAYVSMRCELRGVLICAGASLGAHVEAYENVVVGTNAKIGRGARLLPGVRIWPEKVVEDGAHVSRNIKSGSARRGFFDDDGITGEVGIDLTPDFCAKLGAVAGETVGEKFLIVGDDGSNVGKALKQALSAGALSAGARVLDSGSTFESQFLFESVFCKAGMGIFARSSGAKAVLRLCDANGLPLCRKWERNMEIKLYSGEIRRCTPQEYGHPEEMSGIGALYARALTNLAPNGLMGTLTLVKTGNRQIRNCLEAVLHQLSCYAGGSIRFHLSMAGDQASFFDEGENYISPLHTLALGCIVAFEAGEDVALPFSAPRSLDEVAERYGRRIHRYLSCPADSSDQEARALAAKQPWVRDGLQNGIRILYYMKEKNILLKNLAKKLPSFAVSTRSIPVNGNPGKLLRAFDVEDTVNGNGEGVLLSRPHGKVLISPLKRGNGLRILAEAKNMEVADELCLSLQKELALRGNLDKK